MYMPDSGERAEGRCIRDNGWSQRRRYDIRTYPSANPV